MVESFGVPPTTISTGIVTYGLVVAALVMTGSKLGQKFGWVLVFRIVIVVFGVAMVLMAIAPERLLHDRSSGTGRRAGAIIVPALMALIAENYSGAQQATAGGVTRLSPRRVEHQRLSHRWHPRHARGLAPGVLLFNVPVTSSPKEPAGDVGPLRDVTRNLASAVGTALAGAMLVTLPSIGVNSSLAASPNLPASLQQEVDLDQVNFVTNDALRDTLSGTSATPAQVDEAVAINIDSRLDALRRGLLILAALSALAIVPVQQLPKYRPGEIPDPEKHPHPDSVS